MHGDIYLHFSSSPISLLPHQARETGESYLDVDCADLLDHDRPLYLQLVRYPQEVFKIFDIALADRYEQQFRETPPVPMQVCRKGETERGCEERKKERQRRRERMKINVRKILHALLSFHV